MWKSLLLAGALATMPAIRAFSLYAAVAVLVNFLLQTTVFVGVMVLDVRRQMVDLFIQFFFKTMIHSV